MAAAILRHSTMPASRYPPKPGSSCPDAGHTRRLSHRPPYRAHHDGGRDPASITLLLAPIMMAAVTLRYTARPAPRGPAQTTVIDSSGPDAGLGWHPRHSAPCHAAVYGSDRLHTCRPGDPAGGPPTTAGYDYDTLSTNRDPAVPGPGPSRGKSSPPRPDRALCAPMRDSDGIHVTRHHLTPRCMARPGFTRTDSATVMAAP